MINKTIFLYTNPDFDTRKFHGISKLYRTLVYKYGYILKIINIDFLKHHHPNEKQILVIAGGDGTIHRVINNIPAKAFKNYIFGIIPSGTANEIAKTLNLPSSVNKAAELIINHEKTCYIKIALINDKYKFLTGCLFGLSNYVLRKTPKFAKHYLGVFSFVFAVIKLGFEIIKTKNSLHGCFLMSYKNELNKIFCTNYLLINSLSLKSKDFRDYELKEEHQSKFSIIYIKQNLKYIDYLSLIIKQLFHRNLLQDKRLFYKQKNKIKLEFEGSLQFLLDGEIYKLKSPMQFSFCEYKMHVISG